MAATYDLMSMPTSLPSNQHMSGLFSPPHTSPEVGNTSDSSLKRHAACDECRTRKLKCSGQRNGCDRCVKQRLVCHYSEQKQMGRPRKRQKLDDEPIQERTPPKSAEHAPRTGSLTSATSKYPALLDEQGTAQQSDQYIDPSLAAIEQSDTDFTNICPGPIAQTIRDRSGPNTFNEQILQYQNTHGGQIGNSDAPDGLTAQYPLDISKWPDYSNFDSLPAPLWSESGDTHVSNSPYPMSADRGGNTFDPDTNPALLAVLPTSPSCSCLANLYLTLSTLSTLSAFPISSHTVETLLAAQRTAREVIYCPVCPRRFQTGSQNLMLGCTLLNVLADLWHKVRGASSEELKKGFTNSTASSKGSSSDNDFISTKEGQSWRKFVSDLIRAYVFGDQPVPQPPSLNSTMSPQRQPQEDTSNCSTSTTTKKKKIPVQHTLLFIIKALERRQRQWHNFDEPTDEFPDRCTEGYSCYRPHENHGFMPAPEKKGDDAQVTGPDYCKVHGKKHAPQAVSDENATTTTTTTTTTAANTTDSSSDNAQRTHTPQDHDSTPAETKTNASSSSVLQKASGADHAVCLMIVKYAMDIVKNLDTQ